MILTDIRLRRKSDNKMFHFVEGYKSTLGAGPILWTIWVHEENVERSQWKKETLLDEQVEKQPFTGIFDDTTWGNLTRPEQDFWNAKGFNFDNWHGKPMFVSDIVKYICDGVEDRVEVIKLNHLVCFKDKENCIKDISIERNICKIYVIGNIWQDAHLIK